MASAGKWEGFSDEDIQFYLDKENEKSNALPTIAKDAEVNRLSNVCSTEEVKALLTDSSSTDVESNKSTPTKQALDLEAGQTSLQVFQQRQKLLEEQNRKRKEVLAKVLNERRKQTLLESTRLKSMQDELLKLDLLLSNDVNILRNEIEVAAIEFADAQKRFARVEKDFIQAKQNLFEKLERKELLTKHLCTIIEQNEWRKAQKLSELMGKLAVAEEGSDHQQLPTGQQ